MMIQKNVSVEDCLKKVENRYQLVLIASKRASAVYGGMPTLLTEEEYHSNDKSSVIAMREIANGYIPYANINDYEIWENQQKDKVFFENSKQVVNNINSPLLINTDKEDKE